jgi:hypothetical protein
MDHLRSFLEQVCSSSSYTYEQVDTLAEIYYNKDITPIALIEWRRTIGFIIRFRIGISSREIACLSRDMAIIDSSLVFDEDFIIDPNYGYLYGNDAIDGAIYVSHEPIFAFGSEHLSKTKLEKYWDSNDT